MHHRLVTTDDSAGEPAAPAPTGLREAKKVRTRANIARAALQLVAEEGLHATTVEAIAARADVSPRTFFNYFDSKDEAVVHLGADQFRRLMPRLFDESADPSRTDPVLRIRDAVLDFLHESDSDPDASADDELMRTALERDPSLFGALHTSMAVSSAEFEAALISHYASESDRERARVGLAVALSLTQTAMQSTRSGLADTPLAELVARYFDLLRTAFTDERPLP